jgi:hypothetical protein
MVTIEKLRKDYFKVNQKYVKLKNGIPTLSSGESLTDIEEKCLQDFNNKIEAGLKIYKTVTA